MKNKYPKSIFCYRRAKRLIPNQSQTLSKAPDQFWIGQTPLFSKRAKGCYIWDVDGKKYIDYIGALGPIILGYGHPVIDNAIKRQLKDGIIFSQPHPLETEVAGLLTKIIPSAEMVRFAKNGADATSGAVRIARAYTRKDIIFYCGYHGAQDWYVAATKKSAGVPKVLKKYIYKFDYNDIESLKKLFKKFKGRAAAVIMEPTYYWPPKNNFLQKVKKLAHQNKALLIFDEIVTGFRWHSGGAQKLLGVTPDISCFGKSMANGMPISAVVGKREIMKKCEDVFFSMTFGGECLSLAAAKANINYLRKNPGVLKHIWKTGSFLRDGIQKLIKKHDLEKYITCYGWPPRFLMDFHRENGQNWRELKMLFQKYMIDRGILNLGTFWNVSYAHKITQAKYTLRVFDLALKACAKDIKAGRVNSKVGRAIKPALDSKLH